MLCQYGYLPAGTHVFTYLARAGTAGTFNVIPTTASEFYFPDVYGRGDEICGEAVNSNTDCAE